ncbi:MAG: hypothetical protein IT210_26335 [Armatimonadetes bacterium]|nr:hypothetical protein [Armatimonadota bacterium]
MSLECDIHNNMTKDNITDRKAHNTADGEYNHLCDKPSVAGPVELALIVF